MAALLHLLLLLLLFSTAAADPRTSLAGLFCNTTNASSSAVLAVNAVAALNNLSTLVGASGFGSVVAGPGTPNSVYGLIQCFRDLSAIDCPLCFSQIRSIQPKCFPGIGGRIYLDGCFGRYANYSFFDEVSDAADDAIRCNTTSNSTNPVAFAAAVRGAVGNVSAAAPGGQGFAVGTNSVSGSTAYALAQCWETLDTARCSSCLSAAASKVVSCAPAAEGRALYTGCYLRYSTELFWNVNQTASSSGSDNGKSKIIWIVLGSSLGVFLLITSIVLWIKRGLWSRRNANFLRALYGPGLSTAIPHSNLYFRYDQLKKSTNNFSLSNKVGEGSYGTVYKATLSGGKVVAVKRLFLNTKQWVDQFLNEVNLINRVRHKNLVRLLGCSVDGPESLLVYEYYYNRSLDLFIFDATPDKHLDWKQRFDIIQGIAEGLSYLHEESETRIIHRDIKASNVLLDEKLKPRITDFGLARSFSEDQTHLSTGIAGTRGYMAPEYVVHGHLTVKADVYSFGILVLEIVTGKSCNSSSGSHAGAFLITELLGNQVHETPTLQATGRVTCMQLYPDMLKKIREGAIGSEDTGPYGRRYIWMSDHNTVGYTLIWNNYKAKTVEKIIDELLTEDHKDEILHVVEVGLLCTQADPHQRPTMSRVVELLRNRRIEEELILSDPPFLDVAMMGGREGEVFNLLSSSSAQDLSASSWMSGR